MKHTSRGLGAALVLLLLVPSLLGLSPDHASGASTFMVRAAKIYTGAEHGLPMFDKNADLEPALVAWLKQELLGE